MKNGNSIKKPDTPSLKAIRKEYPFKSRYLKLDHGTDSGFRKSVVHYIDEGEGDPIVFVHGNPTWSFYFRHVINQLRGKYRCIAIDQLGCGLSEKITDYKVRLEHRGEFLNTFLDALEIDSCHFVVHDWGGAVTMSAATRKPERLKTVTITNTAAFPSDRISWRINLCRMPVIGRCINYWANGFLQAAMRMTTVEPLTKCAKTGYLLPYKKIKNRESIDQFVKDIPMNEQHPSYDELSRVGEALSTCFKDQQVLIMWGLRDFCFSDYFLKKWKETFPEAASKEFGDAGHFLFEEAANECVSLMETFYQNLPNR
jgi:pimeloyl-ACP methyl ester carboxylesterase